MLKGRIVWRTALLSGAARESYCASRMSPVIAIVFLRVFDRHSGSLSPLHRAQGMIRISRSRVS